jgi:DNA repair protein RadD
LITLRGYQHKGIAEIRQAFAAGAKSVLYVLPTGGGKTVMFSAIAESSERRAKRALILDHRVELVDQCISSLEQFNVHPEIIAAGYQRTGGRERVGNRAVAVASVQTLVNRLDTYPAPSLIVCDEAHHVKVGGQYDDIFKAYRDSKLLGVTATPIRLDGRGLKSHFEVMIMGPTPPELIELGYLVRPRIFAPPTVDTSGLHLRMGEFKTEEADALVDTPAITGDAFSHYKKHADGLPGLAFCTSVKHADHVADRFRRDGVAAVALNGGTDKQIRRMVVADFRRGAIKILASCDLFSEGFDVPGAHVGIMLRPTNSLGLFLQQCGRLARPAPGKEFYTLLDHVGNTQRFGMPHEARQWELTADVIKKKKVDAPGIRVCPKCFAASPARALMCVECKHVFEVRPRQNLEERDGELVELTPQQIAEKRAKIAERQAQSMAGLDGLRKIARIKGHSEGWAEHVFAARQKKRRPKIPGALPWDK